VGRQVAVSRQAVSMAGVAAKGGSSGAAGARRGGMAGRRRGGQRGGRQAGRRRRRRGMWCVCAAGVKRQQGSTAAWQGVVMWHGSAGSAH